jgi:hypothetical protein
MGRDVLALAAISRRANQTRRRRLSLLLLAELKTGSLRRSGRASSASTFFAVDDLFRTLPDMPTTGLLLCESHRTTEVSQLSRNRRNPEVIRQEVPTVEDLQQVVSKLGSEIADNSSGLANRALSI